MKNAEEIRELRRAILRFRDELLLKSENQRTDLDAMVIETSQALADALIQYQRPTGGDAGKARTVTSLLRAYNEVNRRSIDIDAIETFRAPVEDDGNAGY